MKKIGVKYILLQVAILFVIAFLVAACCGIFAGFNAAGMETIFIMVVMCLGIIVLISNFSNNPISDMLVKKTLKKNVEKHNFENCSTFFTLNGVIKIDVQGGRIAYVSNLNPFEFQVGSAKNIDNIVSDYVRGPFGGTSGVYFQFTYNGKKMRCYTFTSRNAYSLESGEVLEGQSKADAFAEILAVAKKAAA